MKRCAALGFLVVAAGLAHIMHRLKCDNTHQSTLTRIAKPGIPSKTSLSKCLLARSAIPPAICDKGVGSKFVPRSLAPRSAPGFLAANDGEAIVSGGTHSGTDFVLAIFISTEKTDLAVTLDGRKSHILPPSHD